jgi:hypothetical protein
MLWVVGQTSIAEDVYILTIILLRPVGVQSHIIPQGGVRDGVCDLDCLLLGSATRIASLGWNADEKRPQCRHLRATSTG